MDVVVLSNISPAQAPARLRNLTAHGLDVPLLANSGPKGPAVKALAKRAGGPVFFVDDIPHASCLGRGIGAGRRPHPFRGGRTVEATAAALAPCPSPCGDWRDVEAFMRARLEGR